MPEFLRDVCPNGCVPKFLDQYVAIFKWEHDLEEMTGGSLQMLMDPGFTLDPT